MYNVFLINKTYMKVIDESFLDIENIIIIIFNQISVLFLIFSSFYSIYEYTLMCNSIKVK